MTTTDHDTAPFIRKLRPAGIGLLVALVLAIATFFFLLRSDLLFMEDGSVIATSRSWVQQDQTYYESAEGVARIDTQNVRFRSEAFRLTGEDVGRRLAYHAARAEQKWTRLVAPIPFLPAGWLGISVTALLVLLTAAGVGAVVVIRRRRKEVDVPGEVILPAPKMQRALSASPRLVRINDVVRYFFRIYRMQLKAPADAPGKIEALEPEADNPIRRFRLGIRLQNDWKWRYMSIRTIGEATGSRSQCFYVIYDTHIVVKIPPVPIRDFSDYIQRIQFETEIVRALAPRKCIIPNVSVILGKVYRFDDAALRSAEQLEDEYIRLLQHTPGLHHCLKIDNDFAFFMDLSRDYFLSHAMSGPAGDNPNAALAEDAGLIHDCRGFENRYGAEKGWICLELQGLYQHFDAALDKRMPAGAQAPSDFQKQRWFHRRLCDPTAPLTGGPETLLGPATDLLDRLFRAKQGVAEAYRSLALPYARALSFGRTRPVKEALVTNLMDLLRWLDQCQVALRDLKPDNLLVSGGSSRYPTFLASATEFTIALIDLETGVIRPAPGARWRQPQLGGTPTYATPTNFSPNRVLEHCYPDIERIFFLQDWHAVICIIFPIVTGRRLFTRAPGLLPDLIEALSKAAAEKRPLEPEFRVYNSRFWKAARDEFDEKVEKYAPLLKAISVEVPDIVTEKLAVFFDRTLDELDRQVVDTVENQDVIRSPRARGDLRHCSHQALIRAMEKAGGSTVEGNAEQLRLLFERLSSLKQHQERLRRFRRYLQQGQGRWTVRHLLEMMFERVFLSMSEERDPVAQTAADAVPEAAAAEASPKDYTLSFTHTADL